MIMGEHHDRSAESGPTREQIIQAFETIRLKLVDNLEEPERSAFWLAVQMRDALRNAAPAQAASTPAARWRANGEADPHGSQYDCERAKLAHGDMTDDEIANALFIRNYDIGIITAAKERIRWLSRALEKAAGAQPSSAANDDPTASKEWNEGCDFALERLGGYLGIDLSSISWDGATETVEGDVDAVIGNILRAKFGEGWGPDDLPQGAGK
jgi:hypothetical protein